MSHSKHISYLKHLHLWADGSSAFSTEDEVKSELQKEQQIDGTDRNRVAKQRIVPPRQLSSTE